MAYCDFPEQQQSKTEMQYTYQSSLAAFCYHLFVFLLAAVLTLVDVVLFR
jgi:hypothetical protein